MPTPTWTAARASLAVTIRHHPDDAAAIAAARRELRAIRAEDYVRRLVEQAPPLTDEQRIRLAALLLGARSAP